MTTVTFDIGKEEDDVLRAVVGLLKTHNEQEWKDLRKQIVEYSETVTEWERKAPSTIEYRFHLFWTLVQPAAEAMAKNLRNMGSLEYTQMKRELQIASLTGLRKFDLRNRSTVMKWLRVAWQLRDGGVGTKSPVYRMAPSIIETKEGETMYHVENLADSKEDDPLKMLVRKEEGKEKGEGMKSLRKIATYSYPWQTAIALWLDNKELLDTPEGVPTYLPRARQRLMRELLCSPEQLQPLSQHDKTTNVFVRRHLLKTLSEAYKNTSPPSKRL